MKNWLLALLLIVTAAGQVQAAEGGKVDAVHHVTDGNSIELPLLGEVHLPEIHVAGFDLSITRHTLMLWLSALIVLVLFLVAARGRAVVPKGLYNALESVVLFIRDEIAVKSIGKPQADMFVPYLLTVFFFILTMNLVGLVPYGHTATGNINVTATLATTAFLMIIVGGVKQYGPIGYLKHLVPSGVPLALAPVMFVVEFMGLFAKPFALAVRLFANMLAGHLVILSLLGLIFTFAATFGAAGGLGVAPISVAFSLFVYLLELLVSLIQAYIFTFLTALFIGMSVHAH